MSGKVDTPAVQRMRAEGAQIVEVLPTAQYDEEHIPGALNIPLSKLTADGVAELDRDRPVIVYCFDFQCDMSPRAAHRFEQLGFTDVYDYVEGIAAWLSFGLPVEGTVRVDDRIGSITRTADTCSVDATVGDLGDHPVADLWVVVDDDGVVHGEVRSGIAGLPPATPVAQVMHSGAVTARPSMRVQELAEKFDEGTLTHVLVTHLDGKLVGIVERADDLRR